LLSIQKASSKDILIIRELAEKVWPQTYSPIQSAEQISYMMELIYSPGSLCRQMENGHQFILLFDEENAVGFASYSEMEPSLFKLHKLYILPGGQGRGAGRFMVDFIIKDIKMKGATSLLLNVNRKNKAKSFYEKLEFKVIREEDIDIGGGYFMTDYVMEKNLINNDL